jgi:haloalkane dehalogenase
MAAAASWDDLGPEVRALYPWRGDYIDVQDGHRMHYLDVGRGETLLMVHGNPTWSFYYRALVKDLSKDYRCVAPDHVGCGLSDKPRDWGYRIGDHVDNLGRLVERLDLRDVTLIVHDWGGPIGYATALERPERFKRFVVFNTGAFLLPLPRSLRAVRIPLFGSVVVQGLNGFLLSGLRWAVSDRSRFEGAVREGYLAPYDSWANRHVIRRFVEEIPIEKNHHNRYLLETLGHGLPRLADRPHMIIWGKRDWVFHPGFLDEWRRRMPGAEFHVFEDKAHWVVEEAHERIVPLIRDFLARHPLSG